MSNYHRVYVPGGTYFFTLVTYNRAPFLTLPKSRDALRESWKKVHDSFPFELLAFCLLPEHLHCIWKLPENDFNYPLRWQKIKEGFTRQINKGMFPESGISRSRRLKREALVWQRRFWEHTIRDQEDFRRHFDYVHFNPVKHGLVKKVKDWPWSTFHKHVSCGIYREDWGNRTDESAFSLNIAGE